MGLFPKFKLAFTSKKRAFFPYIMVPNDVCVFVCMWVCACVYMCVWEREREISTETDASLQSRFRSFLQKGSRGCVDGCVWLYWCYQGWKRISESDFSLSILGHVKRSRGCVVVGKYLQWLGVLILLSLSIIVDLRIRKKLSWFHASI